MSAVSSCFNLPLMCFLIDHSNDVKLGNPLLVLIQSPFQLLSHLLFERQVSPDRYTKWLNLVCVNITNTPVVVQCSVFNQPHLTSFSGC